MVKGVGEITLSAAGLYRVTGSARGIFHVAEHPVNPAAACDRDTLTLRDRHSARIIRVNKPPDSPQVIEQSYAIAMANATLDPVRRTEATA